MRPTATFAAAVLALALATTAPGPVDGAPMTEPATSPTADAGVLTVADASDDVEDRTLDIRRVRVRNGPAGLAVRVSFPGVARTYDFPTGAISVWLDTDATRRGPEHGHFMDFWSDYRFAETSGWRERPTAAWGHSPEGRCVTTAGLRSDRRSRLRWFDFLVRKVPGCFDPTGPVRVAVTTINTGDLEPSVVHDPPQLDHLGGRHRWTPWVPVG